MKTRPLKFRIWLTKYKKWYDGPWEFHIKGNLGGDLDENVGEFYKIQQFIGLLDNNGKEIYEGDIIKYKINGHKLNPDEIIDQVYYWKGRIHPECENNPVLGKNCEIIGNIFENPELLEKL